MVWKGTLTGGGDVALHHRSGEAQSVSSTSVHVYSAFGMGISQGAKRWGQCVVQRLDCAFLSKVTPFYVS